MNNNRKTIRVSKRDIGRMRQLVDAALNTHSGVTLEYVQILKHELSHATVLPAAQLPADVVSLNSTVWAKDTENGQSLIVTLVLPDRAGSSPNRVSIISPLGMALYGYAAGDRLEWGPSHRRLRLKIDRVKQAASSPVTA